MITLLFRNVTDNWKSISSVFLYQVKDETKLTGWRDPHLLFVFLVDQCFVSQHVEIYWTSDFYTVINFYG